MTTAAGESESSRLRTACNQAHRVPDLTQAPYLRRNAERRRLTACSGAEAYTLFALAKPALPGSRSIGVPQRHLRVDNRPSGGHTAPQRPVGAMHDTRGGDGLVDVHLAEPYPLDTFPGKGEYSPPDRSQDTVSWSAYSTSRQAPSYVSAAAELHAGNVQRAGVFDSENPKQAVRLWGGQQGPGRAACASHRRCRARLPTRIAPENLTIPLCTGL